MMQRINQCTARGPYREYCTDHAGHRYAHYDASKDTSWTDHMEDHRDECECDLHRPDLYEDRGEQDSPADDGRARRGAG